MNKVFISPFLIIIFIFTSICLSACKSQGSDFSNIEVAPYFDEDLPSGVLEFTNLVLDSENCNRIIPLGAINPPGHTFPTDHIYLLQRATDLPVYAPASGKVIYIHEPSAYGDRAIRIGVTNTMSYYLGHIILSPDMKVGDTVTAGQQIATTGNTSCVDFGLLNKNIVNGFINKNLPLTTIYGDKPLSYYIEPLRTQLYSLVMPPEAIDNPAFIYDEGVTDGLFTQDKIGSLSGNWFEEGSFADGKYFQWEQTLAFTNDVYYPNQIRIAIGKDIPFQNLAVITQDSPINPGDVTIESGIITYYLYNANNTYAGVPTGSRIGLMLVQMLSDTRIRVEIFWDTVSENKEFTDSSWFYER